MGRELNNETKKVSHFPFYTKEKSLELSNVVLNIDKYSNVEEKHIDLPIDEIREEMTDHFYG